MNNSPTGITVFKHDSLTQFKDLSEKYVLSLVLHEAIPV